MAICANRWLLIFSQDLHVFSFALMAVVSHLPCSAQKKNSCQLALLSYKTLWMSDMFAIHICNVSAWYDRFFFELALVGSSEPLSISNQVTKLCNAIILHFRWTFPLAFYFLQSCHYQMTLSVLYSKWYCKIKIVKMHYTTEWFVTTCYESY